jgi:RNA polymerase sigma-70 factor (ECF subfamily)
MKDKLAIKIIRGEEQAFELFFHKSYLRLCQFANKFLNNPEEAREVVQEAFIALWEKREMIDPEESLLSYLFKVVQNKSINKLRHKHVEAGYVDVLKVVYSEHNDITPVESLLALELDEAIGKTVAGLPPQCRKVFELSRYNGLRYSEIAGAMDISVKTVEAHMSKALGILRDELKNYL